MSAGRSRPLSRLLGILVAAIAVEAVLMPIAALFFSRVTFAGLILNFGAIPLMAVAQLAGMIVVAVALASPSAAAAAGLAAHAGAEGLVWSSTLVDWIRVLTWRVAPPHWSPVAVYYVALLTAWTLWRRTRRSGPSSRRGLLRRVAGLAAFAAASAAVWILFEPGRLLTARGDGRLHVIFVDVGQGDAAVVRFPRGRTLLVDAGGASGSSTFDIGDRVVGAVLRDAGIRRLDITALTHGDGDHIGGLTSVLREFSPSDVWEGIAVPRSGPLAALRAAATAQGARWTNLQTDDRISIDGVEVVVRHPGIADWERQRVRNDDSIVLELLWRDVSIVLTGDIGGDAERAIAPLFGAAGIRVLKVPHHGSRTSSSPLFLDALVPRVAIVSAGRGNTFGHPAPDVLQRYRDIGAEIFRTDQDGAIEVATDGYSVSVKGFTGKQLTVR
jgi:competence protein ComEC